MNLLAHHPGLEVIEHFDPMMLVQIFIAGSLVLGFLMLIYNSHPNHRI